RIDDAEDSVCRFLESHAERTADGAEDRVVDSFTPELEAAAAEGVGIEIAEHEVRVGDGRRGAATAVADRSGVGARALGSDLERPRFDRRDRSAAGADRFDVDHGKA